MRWFNYLTTGLSLLMAAGALFYLFAPASWMVAIVFALIAAYAATAKIEPAESQYVVQLKGFAWKLEDFCRGWLITGDTGSGKTRSGINQLLFQVFKNDPKWGGLCIDDKGVYWETLVEMATTFHRQNDLILLQVKPDGGPHGWKPRQTFNLLSDSSIPPSTYAKFVVDTVTSLGQRTEQSFFKNQAQTHIGLALELLSRMEMETSLQNIRNFLLEEKAMNMVLKELETDFPTTRDLQLKEHFEQRYRGQPAEQMGGVKETISNYLQFFLTPDIAQIFCASKNSFDFKDIDRGKIICVAMPQKYQMERRYINTFLKMLFYTHALRRFDRPKEERARDNLIILWADEAQRFVSASEDGMSDYNCVDVMREAKATLVAAAQSSTSFIPPLGEEKAQVLTLNLRNRMIFKAADETGAVESADFLGQRKTKQKTSGFSGGMATRSYTTVEEHKIKPYQLRHLRKHQCILVHCEKGFRKTLLPPLDADGKIAAWFPWWKRFGL
jgi:Type IV secretion-system coupling protein DNA-binding domain